MQINTLTPARGRIALGIAGALLASVALAGGTSTAAPVPEPTPATTTTPVAKNQALLDLVNRRIGLHASELVRLDVDPTPGRAKETIIPLGDELVTLTLTPHSLRSEDFHVYAYRDGGLVEIDPGPVRTYRGAIAGDEGSIAGGGINDDGMTMRVVTGNKRVFWIEPIAPHVAEALDADLVAAMEGFHVVYQSSDVVDTGMECGTQNFAGDVAAREQATQGEGGGTASASGGNAVCEIAFDVDNRYLLFNPTAQDRIETIFASITPIYEDDVDITYDITTFIIREEPYYPQPPSSIELYLALFRSEWIANQGSVVRDVAELFTGWGLSGGVAGIAYLSGICNANGYNVVENRIPFAERVHVSAHELGHNWSADHCSCSGFLMHASFPPVSSQFHPTFTIPQIVNFRSSRGCLGSPPPANDDCSGATPRGDGLVAFDSGGATTDGPDLPGSCDEGGGLSFVKDVWFDYTAPCTGTATAQTCISGTFDTRLAIYAGETCVGSFLACNDDACGPGGLQSEVSFPVVAGQHYRVRIGGVDSGGTGILKLECVEGVNCPEDLDMSGAVDFGDILAILAAWGSAGGPEDLDMSGFVDFGDLLAVLGAWGACP